MIRNFKLLKLKFKKCELNVCCRYLHDLYDEKCNSTIEFNSFKTIVGEEKIRLKDYRVKGVPVQLDFYDSHLFNPKAKYGQSSIRPTVLLLPGGASTIKQYHYIIGSLVAENFRVLAFTFPGNNSFTI